MTPVEAYEFHILQRRLEYLHRKDIVARWTLETINPDLVVPDSVLDQQFSDINTFDSFMSCLIKGRKNANANTHPSYIQTVHGKGAIAGAANVNSVSANTAA